MIVYAGNGHSSRLAGHHPVRPPTRTLLPERLSEHWQAVRWARLSALRRATRPPVLRLVVQQVFSVARRWEVMPAAILSISSSGATTSPTSSACMRKGTRSRVSCAAQQYLTHRRHREPVRQVYGCWYRASMSMACGCQNIGCRYNLLAGDRPPFPGRLLNSQILNHRHLPEGLVYQG